MSTVARHLSIVLLFFGHAGTVHATQKADLVKVDKGESRLDLIREGEVFASFGVVFGANPRGHKQQQGDERTPEGRYVLDYKNAASSFYRSIHVSYPNAADRERARKRRVDPGGDIMIHGQPNGWEWLAPLFQLFNWTDGCIALRNKDMDLVWDAVDPGIPVEIAP
jgi:murein L,D-transpeptidase YafK